MINLHSVKSIRAILSRHNLVPNKGLGQNFLVDRNIVGKLVAAAELQPEDIVLEIGPGIGTVTQELARRAKRVIAVEKDAAMVKILHETLAEFGNVEIIHADVLKVPYTKYKIQDTNYNVVANLPYYITAPVIRKFLELREAGPHTMTLVVQKEVGQRICAKPPDMNILAVSVQVYATPKIIGYIKKGAFWPQPKVEGAILHILPFLQPYPLDFPQFFTVVKAGFTQPRKQLLNNFSTGLMLSRSKVAQWLAKNNINPTQRAQTLSLQDWINLTKDL